MDQEKEVARILSPMTYAFVSSGFRFGVLWSDCLFVDRHSTRTRIMDPKEPSISANAMTTRIET